MKQSIILAFAILTRVATATSLDQPHDLSINAETLIAAYEENEVAANAKYGGLRAAIGGIVHKVGVDADGDPYVLLAPTTGGGIHYVRCKFSERFNAKVARLNKGALIGVHGVIVGGGERAREPTSAVIVKDCSL